jgi:hypothetical protein
MKLDLKKADVMIAEIRALGYLFGIKMGAGDACRGLVGTADPRCDWVRRGGWCYFSYADRVFGIFADRSGVFEGEISCHAVW